MPAEAAEVPAKVPAEPAAGPARAEAFARAAGAAAIGRPNVLDMDLDLDLNLTDMQGAEPPKKAARRTKADVAQQLSRSKMCSSR